MTYGLVELVVKQHTLKILLIISFFCQGEMDDSAIDVNLSGNMFFDKVIYRYFQNTQLMPLKIGELNGETKLSGSLLKPYVSFCILRNEKKFS